MEQADHSNDILRSDDLPTPDDKRFEQLAPSYMKMVGLLWGCIFAAVVIANVVVNFLAGNSFGLLMEEGIAPFLIGGSFIILILTLTMPRLMWRSQGYQLRDKDVHYKHGIIWRAVTSLPYVRVQHVELESGPLERVFKLATLKFYTAGGGSSDMKIPGLPFATASKIRAFVMQQAGEDSNGNSADE